MRSMAARILPPTRMRRVKRTLLIALLFARALAADPIVIKAARMFDGKSDALLQNVVVTIDGGTITSISQGAAPVNAIDLGDVTLMPGLIDCHTHVALHAGDYDAQILRETPELRAIEATVSGRKMLEAGVTTIRDLGNEGSGDRKSTRLNSSHGY